MKKWFYALLTLTVSCWLVGQNHFRNRERMVFCDVGQGDAIYFRLARTDILIDAGPFGQVINCLNEEMPYFDRQIELVFITHPEKDHYQGLTYLLDYFEIKQMIIADNLPIESTHKSGWQKLIRQIKAAQCALTTFKRGDQIEVGRYSFSALTPFNSSTVEKINHNISGQSSNNAALTLLFQAPQQQALLLADLDAPIAERAIQQINLNKPILKVSHHGSRYGTSPKLLSLADPILAVLSVGVDNSYHHPFPGVIRLLGSHQIPIRRTDREGKIVIELSY